MTPEEIKYLKEEKQKLSEDNAVLRSLLGMSEKRIEILERKLKELGQ